MEMESRTFLATCLLASYFIYMGMGSRANTIKHTKGLKLNTPTKLELRSEIVRSIAAGIQIAVDQCRDDFKWERWNCSELEFSRRYNSPVTREMAYVASITAAGITYAVARSCARGTMLPECRCLKRGKVKDWELDNCNMDLKAGQEVSRMFLSGMEKGAQDVTATVNQHNYELGIKAVELQTGEECKCHGVSGSCTTRTCWGRVAPFPKVGKMLKALYQRALRVAANRNNKQSADHDVVMLFLEDSPDYCKPNVTQGWPGTEGRICSRRNPKMADRSERRSCRELCRSCGHQVRQRAVKTEWRCNCTFHWCCNVTCSTCTKTEKVFHCDASPSVLRRRRLVVAVNYA